MQYDPARDPNPEDWLALDEDERLEAVLDFHQNSDEPLPESGDWMVHANFHVIVENQLALNDPPEVRRALDRLIGEGLDRHQAIHAIGSVLASHVHRILGGNSDESIWQEYERAVSELSLDTLREYQEPVPDSAPFQLPPEVPDRLQELLDSAGDEEALGYCEACGFLFAVAGSPEPIARDEWLVALLDGHRFDSQQQAGVVEQDLVTLCQWIGAQALADNPQLPPGCHPAQEALQNFGDDAGFGRWSLGFATGYSWLSDVWDQHDPDEEEAFGMSITTLCFFSRREIAEDIYDEVAKEVGEFEAFARTIVDLVPEALGIYAGYGLQARQEEGPEPTGPVRSNKVGRNEPCPCGSGKKYKKCCGRPH